MLSPMSSDKIESWTGMTKTHRFSVEFYADREQGLFRAILEATTPPLAQTLRHPGQSPARIREEEPIRLREQQDLDVLKGVAKVTIKERFGEILQIREIPLGK